MTVVRHNPWQIFIQNVIFYCIERHFKKLLTVIITRELTNSPWLYTENALSFRWTLMNLHLLRMRRNVNGNVFNDRKIVSVSYVTTQGPQALVSVVNLYRCTKLLVPFIQMHLKYSTGTIIYTNVSDRCHRHWCLLNCIHVH